jgi:hypothetical protein
LSVVLVTHELDIADYGTRIVSFRDGIVQSDAPVAHRRDSGRQLALFDAQAGTVAQSA